MPVRTPIWFFDNRCAVRTSSVDRFICTPVSLLTISSISLIVIILLRCSLDDSCRAFDTVGNRKSTASVLCTVTGEITTFRILRTLYVASTMGFVLCRCIFPTYFLPFWRLPFPPIYRQSVNEHVQPVRATCVCVCPWHSGCT